MKLRTGAATVILASTLSHIAWAQQFPTTGEAGASFGAGTSSAAAQPTYPPAPTQPTTQPAAPMAAPGYPAAPAPGYPPPAAAPDQPAQAGNATEDAASDHRAMVGRLALGYLGYVSIPYGALAGPGTNEPDANRQAVAPVIGIRYWLSPSLGIDAGLGVTTTFGTQKVETAGTSVSTNATAPTGLAVHFGLPLALKAAKHYAFEIIPETNIGYAQQAISNTDTNLGTDHSGIHLDVGARAGAELHFGFIGVPELSLVGSVGLRVDVSQTKTEDKAANITTKDSRSVIHTTVGSEPWDIFVGNISAFYYL